MKIFLVLLLALLEPGAAHASFEAGIGYATENMKGTRFPGPNGEEKGVYNFHTIELRGAWFFLDQETFRLGVDAQIHQSVQSLSSPVGPLQFRDFSYNFVANLSIWRGLGIEGGLGGIFLIRPNNSDEGTDVGFTALIGVTYKITSFLEARFRLEDKALINETIQPGYTYSLSYLF